MKKLIIANHKGGVGKTATARALADVMAALGVKVLLIDSDPQGSLTLSCGITDPAADLANVYSVAQRPKMSLKQIALNISPNLDLAPAGLALAAAETELVSSTGREFVLSDALANVTGYDLAIIDCPPALGQLVINALCAADAVLIPSLAQPIDIAGVKMFLETVNSIKANQRLNPNLAILGIIPTFYDSRLTTHINSRQAMISAGWPVLDITIPRSVRVAESAAIGKSINDFEPNSPAAAAYNELGKVVNKWLKNKS